MAPDQVCSCRPLRLLRASCDHRVVGPCFQVPTAISPPAIPLRTWLQGRQAADVLAHAHDDAWLRDGTALAWPWPLHLPPAPRLQPDQPLSEPGSALVSARTPQRLSVSQT